MNVQFNPQTLVPLGESGTVYPTLRITDVWGVLTVDDGALLTKDWSTVYVAAPRNTTGETIEGSGWRLVLKPGWTIRPRGDAGDYLLARE